MLDLHKFVKYLSSEVCLLRFLATCVGWCKTDAGQLTSAANTGTRKWVRSEIARAMAGSLLPKQFSDAESIVVTSGSYK